jgi:apolipoprotein N-acyltransferase
MKRNLILSLLTAILLAFALPPFRTGFIGWFALIPFFFLLEEKKIADTLRWSYLTGLFICITTLYWIGHVTQAGFIGAILIIPLYLTLYGVLHVLLLRFAGRKGWLLLPFIWVAIEYLQSRSELAFPWIYLGYTQSYYLPLIQYAEYAGIWAVSFWVMLLNVMIWLAWQGKNRRTFLAVIALLIVLPALQGSWVLFKSRPAGRQIRIALLQGNVDPFEKWAEDSTERNVVLYEGMSRAVAKDKPDLIVWPETALPFYLRSEPRYLRRIERLSDSLAIPVLTGSLDYHYTDDTEYDYYNATFLLTPGTGFMDVYHKMRLVPGSERIPYREYFPFNHVKDYLTDLALGVGDYSLGNSFTVFQITTAGKPVRFATPICYESVFPDLVRRFIAGGAEMLCIVTNDAWFGRTSAPYQHAQFAVIRAIENRVPVARCANTGVSCFIDACGRLTQRSAIFKPATLVGEVSLGTHKTLYTRWGDWFALLCLAIAGAGVVAAGVIRIWSGKKHEDHR